MTQTLDSSTESAKNSRDNSGEHLASAHQQTIEISVPAPVPPAATSAKGKMIQFEVRRMREALHREGVLIRFADTETNQSAILVRATVPFKFQDDEGAMDRTYACLTEIEERYHTGISLLILSGR